MPPSRRVESARNPLVKQLAALKERRARERTGRTLVEGAREVARALGAGLRPESLLVSPPLWSERAADAQRLVRAAETSGAEVIELSPEAFDRVSLRQHPDGVAAIVPSPAYGLDRFHLPTAPLVLVLDGVEKPGNVGALLRTADAAGVDGVLLTGAGTDLSNPNVIRASMGSVFAMPIATASDVAVRAWLRAREVRIVATSPSADRPHWDASYRGATAVVVGSEHAGLSRAWLDGADERVRIAMRSRLADSLNVAVAGAVILFEALRQRQT